MFGEEILFLIKFKLVFICCCMIILIELLVVYLNFFGMVGFNVCNIGIERLYKKILWGD